MYVDVRLHPQIKNFFKVIKIITTIFKSNLNDISHKVQYIILDKYMDSGIQILTFDGTGSLSSRLDEVIQR